MRLLFRLWFNLPWSLNETRISNREPENIAQEQSIKMEKLSNGLFVNCGPNRGLGAVILVGVLLFIALSIVILRIYIRAYVLHNTGYDDYLILISLVSVTSFPYL